jgi:hypothetical protein
LHWSPQHSAPAAQSAPSGVQEVPPQKPPAQIWPAQHASGVLQATPVGVHEVPPQKPLTQSNPQQSVVSAQATPSGSQRSAGLQTPPTAQTSSPQQVTPVHASPR